ncbi:putative phage tail protein [Clostridium sp. BJN0013]|uniref:putative phage tail protein n=1 Tax=Clostridium sp. BJN0013 TaxID=3236840 RepID=UPI0034C6C018
MSNTALKSYLPQMPADTKIFDEVLNSEDTEFNNMYGNIDDIKAQLNIDTATWALDIYERELGIITDYTKALDYRRSVIKSNSRGTGKLNAALIKLVCDSFSNGDVEVTFDGIIHIAFVNVYGVPSNMQDLKNAVNEIKPAYLLLDYIYIYMTWNEFDNYNKTFDQWDALNLTWDEFEAYKG